MHTDVTFKQHTKHSQNAGTGANCRLLLSAQGKDFAPRQHPQQAQRAPTSARSPPQASRKRKAQQDHHISASTGSRPLAGNSPSCDDILGQAGQASIHNRLKSIGSRRKQAPPSEGATPSRVGVSPPQHSQQQSCSVDDAQQATGSLPLPGSTLQAQVSGIPHTQLVLNTMQQLSRTLSSEPHVYASSQGLTQPGMLASADSAAAAAVCSSAASAALVQAQGTQQREQCSVHQSMSAGPSPILQPFLAPAVNRVQACQSAPELAADSHHALQGADEEAGVAKCGQSPPQLGSISPDGQNPLHTGEGQAERQIERQSPEQADRQLQKQTTSASEQQESGCITHMQTGNALQQLISRAQKLKEQLDAHAARRYDRPVKLLTPVHFALACLLSSCMYAQKPVSNTAQGWNSLSVQ